MGYGTTKHGAVVVAAAAATILKRTVKKEKETHVLSSRRVRFSSTSTTTTAEYCPINLLQDICQGFISSFSILKRTSAAGWLLYIGFYFFFQWPATKLLFFRCKYYTIHTHTRICIPIMSMWVCVGVQLLFYTGRRWRKGRYKRNNKSVFSRRSPAAINNNIRSFPAVCDQIVQQVDNHAVVPISQRRSLSRRAECSDTWVKCIWNDYK